MEGIISRLEKQTSSILDTAHTIVEDAEPKINEITSNVAQTKVTVQARFAQAVETWDEITNRARAQADRLHELVSRIVSKARVNDVGLDPHSPVRHTPAILDAVKRKGELLAGHRRAMKGL